MNSTWIDTQIQQQERPKKMLSCNHCEALTKNFRNLNLQNHELIKEAKDLREINSKLGTQLKIFEIEKAAASTNEMKNQILLNQIKSYNQTAPLSGIIRPTLDQISSEQSTIAGRPDKGNLPI